MRRLNGSIPWFLDGLPAPSVVTCGQDEAGIQTPSVQWCWHKNVVTQDSNRAPRRDLITMSAG